MCVSEEEKDVMFMWWVWYGYFAVKQ